MNSSVCKAVLENLGYPLLDMGDYWQSSAVFRGGDNPRALQIYKESGVWKDYVAGENFLPFSALVEKTVGKESSQEILKDFSLNNRVSRSSNQKLKISQEKIFDFSELNNLLPHYSFYINRDITPNTLQFLKSGMCTSGIMYQRYVFPIFNKLNQIHGFAGRDMLDGSSRPKWKHMGKKTQWIYPCFCQDSDGSYPVLNSIISSREVYIVESIGDMLSLFERGFKNVLVTFGLDISPSLLSNLMGFNLSKIWLCFNNDIGKDFNAGQFSAVKNFLKLLSCFNSTTINICLPTKSDFGEMKDSDFENWLKKKQFNSKNHESIIFHVKRISKHYFLKNKISKNIYQNIKHL